MKPASLGFPLTPALWALSRTPNHHLTTFMAVIFSTISMYQNHPESILKTQLAKPHPQSFRFRMSGVGCENVHAVHTVPR